MNEWIDWFQRVLDVSIRLYFRQECDLSSVYDIALPKAGPLWKALLPEQVDPTFDEWMVLMLALMPHLSPQVLDIFFVHNKNFDRPYTEFGGWKGLSHGGFLPTGETAVFLLAGDRVERRLEVVRLFREEHWFHMYHVVGLEGAGNGEPFLSGQLRISEDFLYRLSFEGEYKPDYNMGFPAKRISTALNWEDAVLPYYVREELEEINNWITGHRVILSDWGLSRFLKAGYRTLFYGPPGTGKTTLAKVIANTTSARFTQINATVAGKKDMEEVVKEAKDALGMYGQKTILFVDEIHRFNKSQQDYLLPFVEDGTLLLIGATTENPYFEVNGALISRSRIFELKQLEKDDIRELLRRAVTDSEKGMGMYRAVLEPEAEEFLADMANGDARAALNAVELGILTTERAEDGLIHIDLDVAQECIQKRAVRYDKGGDNHYDTISAFIKSMRGSDPDAAVYYLARMLYAGEDIKFIARRIMICASEDVGNADPMALTVAVSASLAVERVGMPEAQIILSNAASYVACAPKSNSAVNAIDAAMKAVKTQTLMPVPPHLQDRHYSGAAALGRGLDYKYAHDYPNHYVKQQYLPDGMEGAVFYEPSDNGYEKEIKARLAFLRGSEE